MTKKKQTAKETGTSECYVSLARLGSQGRVIRDVQIAEVDAVKQRLAGNDVVVCGTDEKVNSEVAQRIENAVGPNVRQFPHERAGIYALPHFQPQKRPPEGHTFYETRKRKAAKKP